MPPDDDNTQSFVALSEGTMVSHYRIADKIGAGGMGEVYLAEDTDLRRHVALKFMPSHAASNADMRARFTREARAVAALSHPNIVTIFEVGEFNGRPFFAMEHVPGETLRTVIKQGKLTTNKAVRLTMQICEGLHKAHESGVVHRDIKPGNIIIDNDGRARLLDFGLAMVTGEEKLTKTGSTLGTVGYMAPEQVGGKQVDHRSDLFSVGVILYEMLTGRRPFEGDNDAAIVRAITSSDPEPVARFKSGVTGELQQIVDKALSKDPGLRYQHADGMLSDLKRLEIEPGSGRKSRLGVWAAVAVFVALVGYFAVDSFILSDEATTEGWTNSVAVLVFRDLSPDQDQAFFCEGMTDEIIGRLSSIRQLKVTSMQSMLRFKGTDLDLKSIGRELGVDNILEGSIQSSGDRIRVRAQLIRVNDDAHLWTERYERQTADVFAIQDEISLAIGEVLEATLVGGREMFAARRGTEDLEAYNNYLQGRFFWRKRTADGMEKALDFFGRAVEIDPNFALAWSGLADTWNLLPGHTGEPYPEAVPNALQAAQTAVDLDDNLAEAHASLGMAYYQAENVAGALQELERALEMNPNYVWSQVWYGMIMGREMRRKDLKIKHLQKALELDPLNVPALNNLASELSDSGLYDLAESYYLRLVGAVPENTVYRIWFAWHYRRAGQYDKAIEQFEKAVEIEPDYWDLYYWYGKSLVEIDRVPDAIAMFERAITSMPDSAAIYHSYGKLLSEVLDSTENAITMFNRAVELNPLHDQAYQFLSHEYIQTDDFEKAIEAVNRAIELSPTNLDYLESRGYVYWSFGFLPEAIASFRQVLSGNPHRIDALTMLGNAAMFDRQYDLADSAFRVVAANTSLEQRGWGQKLLTSTLRHQGRFRETVAIMNKNMDTIRQEVGLSHQLASLFWERSQMYSDWIKDCETALADLDSCERISLALPNDPMTKGALESVQAGRPIVYAIMGDFRRSDSLRREFDSSRMENYDLWSAHVALWQGKPDVAIEYFKRVGVRIGHSTNDNGWLGLAYLNNREYEKAIESLEYTVFHYDGMKANYPAYAVWTRYHLAQAYEGAGRLDDAIEQYETFLDIRKNADKGLESVEDAKKRLARLKAN
jgi:serine/threonine protein kinase/tetratricopeptide (TPR) repeat protein